MHHLLAAAVLVVYAVPLSAQTPVDLAAASITAPEITRHIDIIAHDSMLGRETPSRGLTLTAQYVADEFHRLGLKPGSYDNAWMQQYRLPPKLDQAQSHVSFVAGGKKAIAGFESAAQLVTLGGQGQPTTTKVVILTGLHRPEALDSLELAGRIVLYVVPAVSSAADQEAVMNRLRSTGLVLLGNPDPAGPSGRGQESPSPATGRRASSWIIHMRPDSVERLSDVLAAAGFDLAHARADTAPAVREIPSLQIELDLLFETTRDTVSNVVGVLPGSDPKLAREYVVFSAHMDHHGVIPGATDSIANGATDNASGVAGLLALAKAFSQPGARPGRSLIFLATSGSTKGFAGSAAFVGALPGRDMLFFSAGQTVKRLRVQAAAIVLNINLDVIGGGAGDSIVVDGMGDVELGMPIAWLMRGHPELRLKVIDGGTAFWPRSDQFAFLRRAIPSLHFHTGPHQDDAPAADLPTTIDADQAARVVRLVFSMAHRVASAEHRPQFSAAGRRQFVRLLEP